MSPNLLFQAWILFKFLIHYGLWVPGEEKHFIASGGKSYALVQDQRV